MRTMFVLFVTVFAASCYNSAAVKAQFPSDEHGTFSVDGHTTNPEGAIAAESEARTREQESKARERESKAREKLLLACLDMAKSGLIHPMDCMTYTYQLSGGRGDAWLHFWSQGINPNMPLGMSQGMQPQMKVTEELGDDGVWHPVGAPVPMYPSAPPVAAVPNGGYASQQGLDRVERKADQARRDAAKAKKAAGVMAGNLWSNGKK